MARERQQPAVPSVAEEEGGSGDGSPSVGKAPSSQRTRRAQSRLSLQSPYPPRGSPRTPRRSTAHHALVRATSPQSTDSPRSPSMRALSAIVSLISPYSAARKSAAFGTPLVPDDEEEETRIEEEDDEGDETQEDLAETDEVANLLYPSLPSAPVDVTLGSDFDEEVHSGPDEDQDQEQHEQEDETQETDEVEESVAAEDEHVPAEDEHIAGLMEQYPAKEDLAAEEAIADETMEDADREEDVAAPDDAAVSEPGPSSDSNAELVEDEDDDMSVKEEAQESVEDDGATAPLSPSPLLSQASEAASRRAATPQQYAFVPTIPPARSPFQSSAFPLPRSGTPSRMGFGALASAPVDVTFDDTPAPKKTFSAAGSVSPLPPQPSFTFGSARPSSSSPALPVYPRLSRAAGKNTSPLARNYDLLARFFAEKATQEGRAEGSSSMASMDDEYEAGGGLTEVEMAGCMRLIEQSFAQGQGAEVERLRYEALERGRLHDESRLLDEEEAEFAHARTRQARGYMSRSPSLPLGASALEAPANGQLAFQSRPSSSFLAPTYQSQDDASVHRSLVAAFSAAPTTAPKRKHRPLYLGPGLGTSATSAALRNSQQAQARRSALSAQRAAQQARVRERGMNGRAEAEKEVEEPLVKRRKLPREPNNAPALFAQPVSSPVVETRTPSQVEASSLRAPAPARPEKRAAPSTSPAEPVRTQTADAMLSILGSGPSIPARNPATPANGMASLADTGITSSSASHDIVNPYETTSRLSRRITTGASSSGSHASSLAAKEKERLKVEREKRQKEMKEREARKESTLDFIRRTAPSSSLRTSRRMRVESEDEEGGRVGSGSAPATTAAPRSNAAEEERRRKTEELKRRTEALLNKSNQTSTTNVATNGKSNGETGKAEQPSQATQASKPFAFSAAFAPKKPSPLSQATLSNAPDSPSGSSESSERESVRLAAPPSKFSFGTATKANTIAIDDDDDDAEPQEAPKKSSTSTQQLSFSFGSKPAAPSQPTFSFGVKPSAVSTPASTSAIASSAVAAANPFAPTSVAPSSIASAASSQKPTTSFSFGTPSNVTTSASAQDQALSTPVATLPKFDFALNLVMPNEGKTSLSMVDDAAARREATDTPNTTLPTFSFAQDSITNSTSAPSAVASSSTPATSAPAFSVPSFSFGAVPASSTAPPATTETSDSPADQPSAAEGASGKSTSALLSGTGEGEEEESCEHEVRCKVFSFGDGKWNDLGIGMLRIKKNNVTAKQRVLVRNEGNGKVTINFRIVASLTPTQDKNVVAFRGFDTNGQPMGYRCKIKTEESARGLKEALETSAKAAAA